MTEQEWLDGTSPAPMLEFLRRRASERKLRLFEVACCRRIWRFITDPESRALVEIIEQWCDGTADVLELLTLDFDRLTDDCGPPEEPFRTAFMVAGHVGYGLFAPIHGIPCADDVLAEATGTALGAMQTMALSFNPPDDKRARFYTSEELLAAGQQYRAIAEAEFNKGEATEQARQSSLLRCIFGNPFRLLSIDSAWLTPDVLTLARTVYDERALPTGHLDHSRLTLLSDALEQAGCTNADILAHLRSPGPHVRGCWALDVVLAKT